MKEARFWNKADDGKVQCFLCAHRCLVAEGKVGICGVRRNEGGVLYTLVWARSIAANVDPIEKKPLFHFLPGSTAFSIATVGCNFKCAFCQNSDISQYPHETLRITGDTFPPEDVVASALKNGCQSISYTYTEPTIYLEYALDTAVLAKGRGLFNNMITNGYTSTEVIESDLKGTIDAANIDLKAFTDSFYKKLCSARLTPVLDAIRAYHAAGIWIEITTLVIVHQVCGPRHTLAHQQVLPPLPIRQRAADTREDPRACAGNRIERRAEIRVYRKCHGPCR
jgi:pyruvate formate lyase activating enzyme